jgi:hypothetical protein
MFLIINADNQIITTDDGRSEFGVRFLAEATAREMPGCRVVDADFFVPDEECGHCYGLGRIHSAGRNGDPWDEGEPCPECK